MAAQRAERTKTNNWKDKKIFNKQMGHRKIKYFIENRRTKEILGGPKSLDQRPFGRTKDILVCGGRTKTDFKDRERGGGVTVL